MSDSLNGTSRFIPLVLTSTMNAELPLAVLARRARPGRRRRAAAAAARRPPPEAADEDEEEPVAAPLLVVPPATVSPGDVLATEATVPEIGASSRVRDTACSAETTWRLALSTPAWAASRFACSVAGLAVGVGVAAVVVVLAAVVVVLAAVVVVMGAVVVPLPLEEVGPAAFFVAGGWDVATVSCLAAGAGEAGTALAVLAALAMVAVPAVVCWPVLAALGALEDDDWLVDPLGLAWTCASLASAASRLARACSRATWALRGSSSASSSPPKTC